MDAFENINDNIFSIYIAESINNIPIHLMIGKWIVDYIHDPKNNPV